MFVRPIALAFFVFGFAAFGALLVTLGTFAAGDTQADVFVLGERFFVIELLPHARGGIEDRLGDRWRERWFVGERLDPRGGLITALVVEVRHVFFLRSLARTAVFGTFCAVALVEVVGDGLTAGLDWVVRVASSSTALFVTTATFSFLVHVRCSTAFGLRTGFFAVLVFAA
jgi:hypothetical protein